MESVLCAWTMFPHLGLTATSWHRQVKGFARSLSATKWQNQDLNLGVLI